jgi:3',5'-nucleoside bisphosphate phosphatase
MIRFKTKTTAKYADLHMHSSASDGGLEPANLAKLATQKSIMVASLTDHDSVNGFSAFRKKFRGIALSGVELSVLFENQDFHVLGYGFDPDHKTLKDRLTYYRKVRHQRMVKMCLRLQTLGIPITQEEVEKGLTRRTAAGRPHIARVMVNRGWVKSTGDAFRTYLNYDKPAYVPKAKMTFDEALELIHQAGGIAVLAHPGKSSPNGRTPLLDHPGLDGIEVWHPDHNEKMGGFLKKKAEENGLICSGGSDFHDHKTYGTDSLGEYGLDINEWMQFKQVLIDKNTFFKSEL